MTDRSAQANLRTYDTPQVAAHYAALEYLTPCERLLFETYIKPGSAILDLGVGGGRTTRYLANRAGRYVGVDYAAAMVGACQAKFPGLEFVVADAADLSAFADSSFDVAIFAFNGIDYVLPEKSRRLCFGHVYRVLKPGGTLIFSTHNSRAVLVPPRWNGDRLRRAARRSSAGSNLLYFLMLAILTSARFVLAFGQSVAASLLRLYKRVPSRVFWRGEGNLVDSVHGGLLTHYSTPGLVAAELNALPFQLERILGNEYPRPSHRYATDWYYYVFAKPSGR
jgi:SAM-dependent methyltransferase